MLFQVLGHIQVLIEYVLFTFVGNLSVLLYPGSLDFTQDPDCQTSYVDWLAVGDFDFPLKIKTGIKVKYGHSTKK